MSVQERFDGLRAFLHREFPEWTPEDVATVAGNLTREGLDAATVTRSTAIEAAADYCAGMSRSGFGLSAEERASYATRASDLVALLRSDKS